VINKKLNLNKQAVKMMNMISDPAFAGMIPFDTMGFYERPKPQYILKMPRVVPEQKEKFESDDVFKKISRDSEVS
jgi:hypothetical protein